MEFQNNLAFATEMDELDPLKHLRKEFFIPKHLNTETIYLCGNSLGLQPVGVEKSISEQLEVWKNSGVDGWFRGKEPWLNFHRQLLPPLSRLIGGNENEITIMNSLTVNLHLMMVSFYKPNNNRYKILIEGGAFPSDRYATESQVRFYGYEPDDAIIEVKPRPGELTLRTEDIVRKINENADELALVLFSGVNYYTGQFYDIKAITKAAHQSGTFAGFDLAHAVGNVALSLHDWKVDFACWCSYKYLNSGPGGISGVFVHQSHHDNKELHRFAGWWGYREDKRFLMAPGFDPAAGAEGWQVSTTPVLLLCVHKAALELFDFAGGIEPLRKKSEMLTAYLDFLIKDINRNAGQELFKIITPPDARDRGCQLSIVCKQNGKAIFQYLEENGVVGDWRESDVIRLAPVPLYNTFTDVFLAAAVLTSGAGKN